MYSFIEVKEIPQMDKRKQRQNYGRLEETIKAFLNSGIQIAKIIEMPDSYANANNFRKSFQTTISKHGYDDVKVLIRGNAVYLERQQAKEK